MSQHLYIFLPRASSTLAELFATLQSLGGWSVRYLQPNPNAPLPPTKPFDSLRNNPNWKGFSPQLTIESAESDARLYIHPPSPDGTRDRSFMIKYSAGPATVALLKDLLIALSNH